jgi:hypothetical protein
MVYYQLVVSLVRLGSGYDTTYKVVDVIESDSLPADVGYHSYLSKDVYEGLSSRVRVSKKCDAIDDYILGEKLGEFITKIN